MAKIKANTVIDGVIINKGDDTDVLIKNKKLTAEKLDFLEKNGFIEAETKAKTEAKAKAEAETKAEAKKAK